MAKDTITERRTKAAKKRFLAAFARSGVIATACDKAKVGRTSVFLWRKSDPEFDQAVVEATEEFVEVMEAEADRRGRDGVDEPILHRGEIVTHVRRYSDTLLIFRLKALKPEKYCERQRIEQVKEHDGPKIEAMLAEMRERMNDPDYIDFLRERELRRVGESGDVGNDLEPRQVEGGEAPRDP